jgi:hypothetical protein
MCTDHRCSNGITECQGCNGWGWLTMGGRKYKRRSGARTVQASTTKQPHQDCHGSGEVVCGCQPVTPERLAEITGRELAGV